MRNRLTLQEKLENILGTRNVYFQPPESLRISYPCIIYELETVDGDRADDMLYYGMKRYKITVIDENPDSTYYESILKMSYARFSSFYVADNLNHFVVELYY